MMIRDDLDARISDWLREQPEGASPRTVEAVLAHARAHPRRRVFVRRIPAGLGAAPGPGAPMGLVRRRPVFAFAGLAAAASIVLVVSFGVLAPIRLPIGPALPVAAPGTSTATAGAMEFAALTGTWTGTIAENAQGRDSKGGPQLGERPDTYWATTMTFGGCGIGVACGSMDLQTSDYSGTGTPKACRFVLTLGDSDRAGPWWTFTERRASFGTSGSEWCAMGSLDVKVSAGGTAGPAESLMVQEFTGGNLLRQGLLTRSPRP